MEDLICIDFIEAEHLNAEKRREQQKNTQGRKDQFRIGKYVYMYRYMHMTNIVHVFIHNMCVLYITMKWQLYIYLEFKYTVHQ